MTEKVRVFIEKSHGPIAEIDQNLSLLDLLSTVQYCILAFGNIISSLATTSTTQNTE
jgi:hypothetical protein